MRHKLLTLSNLIYQNEYVEIRKSKNIVEKKFVKDSSEIFNFSEEWLETYNDFQQLYQCVPKIFEANQNKIVMEYIEGIRLDDYQTQNKNNQLINISIADRCVSLVQNCLEYSSQIGKLFLHSDMHPKNFIVRKDNSFCLIDPDSFVLYAKDFTGFTKLILELSKNYTIAEIYNLEKRIRK
jgi:RIO-like serine/threonine protein kinase